MAAAMGAPRGLLAAPRGSRWKVAYIDMDTEGARGAHERFRRQLDARIAGSPFSVEVTYIAANQTEPGDLARIPEAIRRLAPDAIIATNYPVAKAVQGFGLPTLFFSSANPRAAGFVDTFERPGGRMTGYTSDVPFHAKMLEILREALPRVRRVGLLVDETFLSFRQDAGSFQEAGRATGASLRILHAESRGRLMVLLDSRDGVEALVVPMNTLPVREPQWIVGELARRRIPAIFASARMVGIGGLLGYDPDIADVTEVWARQLEAMLRGVAPGELPVETPRRFRLSINLSAARALGIAFAPSFLKRADLVF